MLAGQPVDAFYASVANHELLSIGLNCATGPDLMTDHIRTLAEMSTTRISCYPNAGLPNEEDKYLETPELLATQLDKFVEHGWLNIVGGCCGTTPAHIKAIAQMAEGRAPRKAPPSRIARIIRESSWSKRKIRNRPLIVGERTNVIGSRLFKSMIADEKWEEASEIARWQVKNGAHIIDVCLQSSDREEIKDVDSVLRQADAEDQSAGDDRHHRCRGHGASAHVVPGQEHHQFDQSRRRRREVRAGLPHREGLRRGAGGRHHRRRQTTGASVHAGAQTRRRPALRKIADRKIWHCARGHHHRSSGVPLRDRRRKLHRRRGRNHRGDPPDQGEQFLTSRRFSACRTSASACRPRRAKWSTPCSSITRRRPGSTWRS